MALLETRGDYQFAENVEELNRSVSKLNKALEEQMEFNHNLTVAIKQLTEVIAEQNEHYQKLLHDVPVTNNLRPDVVLM
jgi:regulator of replication initiation timing